jgi:hypothetical protein
MKQLLGIAIAGMCGVLLLAEAAKAAFDVFHGRPFAHATGWRFIVLRDGLAIVVLIVMYFGPWVWQFMMPTYPNPKRWVESPSKTSFDSSRPRSVSVTTSPSYSSNPESFDSDSDSE